MTDPNISRRDFVRYAGFGLLALSLPPVPASLLERREYISDALGFRFTIPVDWRWVSAVEIEAIRENTVLPGGDEAKHEVIEMAGTPLVVATKFTYPKRGPTLVLWRQPVEDWHHSASDNEGFAKIHDCTYRDYKRYLKECSVEHARPDLFAGLPASLCITSFIEEDNRGGAWPVRIESHMFRWRQSWLTFNFLDLQTGWGAGARSDFANIEALFGPA